MWTSTVSSLFFSLALIALSNRLLPVVSYTHFPARIPNGQNVPNPCQPQNNWPGVGHQAVGGAGIRNPFGLDFAANGFMWNPDLCQKDSDGDGRSNGQELGDPNCGWTEGEEPENNIGITHPGVCEPLDSMACMDLQPWLKCPANFTCPDLDLPTTQNISIQFPRTPIPEQETTYLCRGFHLPTDNTSHIIGVKPIIDNEYILHHMTLYACEDPLIGADEPFACNMGAVGCTSLIVVWTVGDYGQCLPKEFGFLMGGESGFKYAVLQLHWNNAMKVPNQFDSSGLMLFYTTDLRPDNGKMLMSGQMEMFIPPRQDIFHVNGVCGPACTGLLPRPVKISSVFLHMHLAGQHGDITIVRKDGQRLLLVNDTSYDYNSPKFTNFEEHVTFNPGDTLLVNCAYRTTDKNVTTEFGEGTQDEMCFAFVTIYPLVPYFDECSEFRDVPVCSLDWSLTYPNCDEGAFHQLLDEALRNCDNGKTCTGECIPLCEEIAANRCMEGGTGGWIRWLWPAFDPPLYDLFKLIETCGVPSHSLRLQSSHLVKITATFIMIFTRLLL